MKPIDWIFISGIIATVATYLHNRSSSARNSRIETGVDSSNIKMDAIIKERDYFKEQFEETHEKLDINENKLTGISKQLEPFIELAKASHPNKSDDEALQLLQGELKRVDIEVEKTKQKYIPQIKERETLFVNKEVKQYLDAGVLEPASIADRFKLDHLYSTSIKLHYATELSRNKIVWRANTKDGYAGTIGRWNVNEV